MSERTPAGFSFVYRCTWILSRLVFLNYFHARYLHPERLPAEGPVILASNHLSFLDPPLVGSGLNRPVNYLARDTLFSNALIRAYLKRLYCVPVDRDGAGAAGLKGILDRLQIGNVVLLFPEGTRSSDGNLLPARAGVGLAVMKSKAPVLPVRIFGTYEAYHRRALFPRPVPVVVKYGHPLDLGRYHAEIQTCSKARAKVIYQEVADAIMKAIGDLEPCEDRVRFP